MRDEPNTESDAPRRAKLRRASEEPICASPTSDKDDPTFKLPTTASDEPRRATLLTANEAPKQNKSNTASDDPMSALPNREIVEPKRAMLLNETVAPICVEASILNVEPNLEKDRKDKELPRWTKSRTEKDAPTRCMPKTDI
jgi:hypothetical protein